MADAKRSFDVVVIGSGPGGYVAAIRAAQLGLKVACIERAELGGICLNWGCIPSKALLHNAKMYQELSHGEHLGFKVDNISVDWSQVIKRSRDVAKKLNGGVSSLFKKYSVTHIKGEARIDRPGLVIVGEEPVAATHIIVATGARPRPLPGLPFDGDKVMSYKEAMVEDPMPKRVLVIGAGAIGVEFAYFFNAFGVEVTLVEMADRIVPVEDADCSKALERSFKKQGIKIKTGAIATDVEVTKKGVKATLKSVSGKGKDKTIEVDRVLVAIGVMANVESLGLEALGVDVERGQIVIDADCKTTCPGIYAIGDVAGPPWLAHKASAEGMHVAERIAGHEGRPVDFDNIPGCTYCEPQVASIGLTEEKCKAQGLDIRVGKFPFIANGKSIAIGETEGFVKVIFEKNTGELLGAHIIGHGATELITELVLARSMEATEAEILRSIHAHPTLSESIHEAIGQAFGESVNF